MISSNYKTVDEYISQFPKEAQEIMVKIRELIHKVAPQVKEEIAYRMPAFKLNGKPLAYFGAFPKHIGFYPTSEPIEAFEKELTEYKHARGSIQFPLDKQVPYGLIKRLIEHRAKILR